MKENAKHILKAVAYLLGYWVVFVIIPCLLIGNENSKFYGYFGLLFIFVLFVVPFLFIIPYKLSKIVTFKFKIIYILFGLILPNLLIYWAIYASMKSDTWNFIM